MDTLFAFIQSHCEENGIDESHGLKHAINCVNWIHRLTNAETYGLDELKMAIYAAALHDMCDKKYMNQDDGIFEIENFLQKKLLVNDIDVVKQIISTMSYSYVKKNGFPILGEYQHAYHIVREADLLSAYDFDRCMTYKLHLNGGDIDDAFEDSLDLFSFLQYLIASF